MCFSEDSGTPFADSAWKPGQADTSGVNHLCSPICLGESQGHYLNRSHRVLLKAWNEFYPEHMVSYLAALFMVMVTLWSTARMSVFCQSWLCVLGYKKGGREGVVGEPSETLRREKCRFTLELFLFLQSSLCCFLQDPQIWSSWQGAVWIFSRMQHQDSHVLHHTVSAPLFAMHM